MPFSRSGFTGFPFDSSSRRTRDPLEDIAQRHPEFAQHLQGFPRRSNRAGGDPDQDEFLRRRFERPFSSGRFERFGFPFDRDDFEREPQRYYEAYPEYFENFQNQQPHTPPHNQAQSAPQQQSATQTSPSTYQQYPPQYSQQYQPHFNQQQQDNQHPVYQTQPSQSVSQGTQTEESESPEEPQEQTADTPQEHKSEAGQTRGRPIQQSNTCDLAQHQPPDEALNERGQRSMSAPPENKRFTSSVNIPMGMNQENNGPPSGGAKSQAGSGSTERVIPIHVEGRDVPVLPKTFAGSTASAPQSHHQQQPQPERVFNDSPRSPETIFGRRPEAFTQFVHREPHRFANDWPHSFGGFPEEEFGFRRSESPSRFAGARPQAPQQSHQQHPTTQQQQQQPPKQEPAPQVPKPQEPRPAEAPPAPKPQPQKQPQTPIEQIQAIQKDVATLLRQVEAFNGAPRDKNYLYLDEMLTRNLLKLDNVETQGQDTIRSARKEAIKSIERTISLLEAKAAANVAPKEEKMEVEPAPEEEKVDADGSTQEVNAMEMSSPPAQIEPMEVAAASEEAEPKSAEAADDSKSANDNVAKAEEVVEEKEVSEEPQKAADAEPQSNAEPLKVTEEPKESNEAQSKPEVKDGEKKEKKKIKKKVNKEDKEKKQS
ncbi:BAG domain-containing protein Samui isoform X2 [Dendroctonus ponderosae]